MRFRGLKKHFKRKSKMFKKLLKWLKWKLKTSKISFWILKTVLKVHEMKLKSPRDNVKKDWVSLTASILAKYGNNGLED